MPIIGLDLGKNNFRAVEIENNKGKITLLKYGIYENPKINIEGDNKEDLVNYANAVREFFNETGFTTQDSKRFESDYYIQDAAFIRLDNVSVGYTFNQKPNSTSLVKLTLAAQNVLLITKYSGLDPEVAGGIDNNLYPRPITFTLGLNVNF